MRGMLGRTLAVAAVAAMTLTPAACSRAHDDGSDAVQEQECVFDLGRGKIDSGLAGRLLILDALAMRWHDVRVPRDPQCPVCAGR